jgi:hypothetical protein
MPTVGGDKGEGVITGEVHHRVNRHDNGLYRKHRTQKDEPLGSAARGERLTSSSSAPKCPSEAKGDRTETRANESLCLLLEGESRLEGLIWDAAAF